MSGSSERITRRIAAASRISMGSARSPASAASAEARSPERRKVNAPPTPLAESALTTAAPTWPVPPKTRALRPPPRLDPAIGHHLRACHERVLVGDDPRRRLRDLRRRPEPTKRAMPPVLLHADLGD